MKSIPALMLMGFVATASAHASILDSKELKIDFSDQKDASAKAEWSEPDKISISEKGLGWDGDPASSRDGWFVTTPLALGFSWRPTISAKIKATIQPPPAGIKMPDGSASPVYYGQLYVRYSCDQKHWSPWQALAGDHQAIKENKGIIFTGLIQVPNLVRQEYSRLIAEYSKLDVPWPSDEDAAVKWIVSKNPKFFEASTPFVGYVQFLYENSFRGSRRITNFSADVVYGMSGMHLPPKDKSLYHKMEIPWSFIAE